MAISQRSGLGEKLAESGGIGSGGAAADAPSEEELWTPGWGVVGPAGTAVHGIPGTPDGHTAAGTTSSNACSSSSRTVSSGLFTSKLGMILVRNPSRKSLTS